MLGDAGHAQLAIRMTSPFQDAACSPYYLTQSSAYVIDGRCPTYTHGLCLDDVLDHALSYLPCSRIKVLQVSTAHLTGSNTLTRPPQAASTCRSKPAMPAHPRTIPSACRPSTSTSLADLPSVSRTCSRGRCSKSRTDMPDEITPARQMFSTRRICKSCSSNGTQPGDVVRIPTVRHTCDASKSGASRMPITGADVSSRRAGTSG